MLNVMVHRVSTELEGVKHHVTKAYAGGGGELLEFLTSVLDEGERSVPRPSHSNEVHTAQIRLQFETNTEKLQQKN